MPIDLTKYRTVPERIAEFREKHPEGSLQPVNIREPYKVEVIEGRAFIVYAAAAYRTPDDRRPGIGVAYEPFPGPSSFTKDSELQNAETSAWGRAIVAALASDTSKAGIASQEEVRNRQSGGDDDWGTPEEQGNPYRVASLKSEITSADIARMRTPELMARVTAAGLNPTGKGMTRKVMMDRLTEHLINTGSTGPIASTDSEKAVDVGTDSAPEGPSTTVNAAPDDAPICPGCDEPISADGPWVVGEEPIPDEQGRLWHHTCA